MWHCLSHVTSQPVPQCYGVLWHTVINILNSRLSKLFQDWLSLNKKILILTAVLILWEYVLCECDTICHMWRHSMYDVPQRYAHCMMRLHGDVWHTVSALRIILMLNVQLPKIMYWFWFQLQLLYRDENIVRCNCDTICHTGRHSLYHIVTRAVWRDRGMWLFRRSRSFVSNGSHFVRCKRWRL